MSIARKLAIMVAPLALLTLGGCATGFRADVARFQAMPAPQGESFAIVAQNPDKQGGLEFSQYARMVSDRLASRGYQPAPPETATMIVKLDYGIDKGKDKIRSSPFAYTSGWYRDPFYWGPYRRYGRGGYLLGFHDPFLFGGTGFNDVESYTVFTSDLDLVIERRADGKRLFEGEAKALSGSDRLTYLVPNLIEAMFTNFPGNSGETINITVPPPARN